MWYISRLLCKKVCSSFCTIDKFGRNLTTQIVKSRTNHELENLIIKNKGSLNLYNITAILKKLNKQSLSSPILKQIIISEVTKTINQNSPLSQNNVRGIANIVGYAGNLQCTDLNHIIKTIKFQYLLEQATPKEFMMAITGLIKLGIIEECIGFESLQELLIRKVTKNFSIGLIISIWRNLLKSQQCTEKLNNYLSEMICQKSVNGNLKDYGYLVYCYLRAFSKEQANRQGEQLLLLLQKYPNSIMYSNRINIYELCNIMEYLSKLQGFINPHCIEQLQQLFMEHYLRNISSPRLDLRSIANGFYSLLKLYHHPPSQVTNQTGKKFIYLLKGNPDNNQDFQSVISLLIQLVATSTDANIQNQSLFLMVTFSVHTMIKQIVKFFFHLDKIAEVSDKQFQKLLYGLYLFKNKFGYLELQDGDKKKVTKQIDKRNLNDLQVISILGFLPVLKIIDRDLCIYFATRLHQIPDAKQLCLRKCVLGLEPKECLKCDNKKGISADSENKNQ